MEFVDAGRDEMLKQYTGQLEAERKIERDGRRGREVIIHVPGRGRFLIHYYYEDRRLYTVMMVGPKLTLDFKEAPIFFDSFHFIQVTCPLEGYGGGGSSRTKKALRLSASMDRLD